MAVTRSAGKRRRVYRFGKNDRISTLPDGILLTILEKLPAENAWRTTQLARRWRNLWKSMSCVDLNFQLRKDGGIEANKFMQSLMDLYEGDRLNRFSLSLRYEKSRIADYGTWIAFALSKNVEELSLELYIYDYNWRLRLYPIVPLPANLFISSSLVRVKLTFANLDPLPPFHLVSLKDLHLSKSHLPDDGIENITAHCPKLQTLTLSNCNKERYLKVNVSPKSLLSRLVIDDKDRQFINVQETSINAPKITMLEIWACTDMRKYSIVNVADVVEATLFLEEMPCRVILQKEWESQIRENIAVLIEKLQAVKILHVCRRCIMTVVEMEKELKFNLTRLVLHTHLENGEILGIILLLRACPGIEHLVFNITLPEDWYIRARERKTIIPLLLRLWRSPVYSLEGYLNNLAVLEFKHLAGPYQRWNRRNFEMTKFMGSQNGVMLVKHLLLSLDDLRRVVFTTAKQQFELISCTDLLKCLSN